MKRLRLWTNREFQDKRDYEAIEIDARGVMYWVAREHSAGQILEACFACGVDWLEECFVKTGRTFDPSRLPSNVVLDPYAQKIPA